MHEVLLIAGMMALTFGPRYLPFALAGKVDLPPFIKEALGYVPIAVLTAIVVQTILLHQGEQTHQLSNPSTNTLYLKNPYLIAALCAFLTSLLSRHLFLTIIVGLVSYGVMSYGVNIWAS